MITDLRVAAPTAACNIQITCMTHTGAFANLQMLARALGGEVSGGQVRAPGPGHSVADRSLSVKLDSSAPDGFVVNSFANDDPLACRDYVRERIGLFAFKPNGHGRQRISDDIIERAVMAAASAQSRTDKPGGQVVSTYDYVDADGKLLYQVLKIRAERLSAATVGQQRRLDMEARRAARRVSLARAVEIS